MTPCICSHGPGCHFAAGACAHCDCLIFEAFDGPEAVCLGCQPKPAEQPKPLSAPEFEALEGELATGDPWAARRDLE